MADKQTAHKQSEQQPEQQQQLEQQQQPEQQQTETINFDELKKTYHSKAGDIYSEISNIAGFGSHGRDHIGADNKPSYPTLDYSGASADAKAAITKLLKEGDK
jgi:hypothetical protein